MSKGRSFKRKCIKNLIERDGFVCGLCGKSLEEAYALYLQWETEMKAGKGITMKRSKINMSIDHLLPKSKGGDWTLKNLVLAHATCNNLKGDKLILTLIPKNENTPNTL